MSALSPIHRLVTKSTLLMATKTRYHRKQNVQTRLKENLVIMVVVIGISLWVFLTVVLS
jgi:hypothetical protein